MSLLKREVETLRNVAARDQREKTQLKEEIASLRGRLQEARNARPTITNNNTIVLALGKEPLPSATDVMGILRPPERSVARYIELKHFAQPETCNVRITNKRARTLQVVAVDGSNTLRWTEREKKHVIEELVEVSLDELASAHGAKKVAAWEYWYRKSGLAHDGYEKTAAWRKVNADVENLILTQRDDNRLGSHGDEGDARTLGGVDAKNGDCVRIV